MSIHRFYAAKASKVGLCLELTNDEANHLTRVLRLKTGASIRIFDGLGHEFTARVESITQNRVTVKTLRVIENTLEPAVQITIAQTVLKGRKFDNVIRDATMLGVAVIQPIFASHTSVPLKVTGIDSAVKRWHKIAVSSAKQSGRAVVPNIRPPVTFHRFLTDTTSQVRILLIEPAAGVGRTLASLGKLKPPNTATIATGPEGGWTKAEINTASGHGFTLLTLGRRTLRADATPIAALAVLQHLWGEL